MADQDQTTSDDLIQENETSLEDSNQTDEEMVNPASSPETLSEQGIGGDADPESDDNALAAAQEVGIGQGADEEHPQPLNIAKDIEDAERSA